MKAYYYKYDDCLAVNYEPGIIYFVRDMEEFDFFTILHDEATEKVKMTNKLKVDEQGNLLIKFTNDRYYQLKMFDKIGRSNDYYSVRGQLHVKNKNGELIAIILPRKRRFKNGRV